MRRATKRDPQGDLFVKPKRRARRGKKLGRPPKGLRAGSAHKERPELKPRDAVHVVLCVAPAVGSLRKRIMYSALRAATIAVALRGLAQENGIGAFRIIHISIQRTHVHLLVEADNKLALSRGMQSFQISAAKHINREYSAKAKLTVRRRGSVFPDRYHQEIIDSPYRARRALSYVLNNWRKHREDRDGEAQEWEVDPFSSGMLFTGWKEHEGDVSSIVWPYAYEDPLVVYRPQTWLMRDGWRKGGGPVSFFEVPGSRQRPATAS